MNFTGNNNNKNSETMISFKLALQIILFVFSVVVFLSLITGGSLFGVAGRAINAFILGVFGHSAYPIFIATIFIAIKLFGGKKINAKRKGVSCGIVLFVSAVLCYQLLTSSHILNSAASYGDYISSTFQSGNGGISTATGGGVLFAMVVYPFAALFGNIGSYIIFGLIFGITMLILFGNANMQLAPRAQSSKKYNNDYQIQGLKEYPSNYFDNTQAAANAQKNYVLPDYNFDDKKVLGLSQQVSSGAINNMGQESSDVVEPVPKKLFVGYIDDYVNLKNNKKNVRQSKSYDILYSSPKPSNKDIDDTSYPKISSINNIAQEAKLGGSSYVDTFGDDLESKKKYILTPIDNLLRTDSDYGVSDDTAGIYPLNLSKNNDPLQMAKPPRINHNMSTGYLGQKENANQPNLNNANKNITINTRERASSYEKYANENPDQFMPNKFSDLKKQDNVANNQQKYGINDLIKKYNNAANEKSAFDFLQGDDYNNANQQNLNDESFSGNDIGGQSIIDRVNNSAPKEPYKQLKPLNSFSQNDGNQINANKSQDLYDGFQENDELLFDDKANLDKKIPINNPKNSYYDPSNLQQKHKANNPKQDEIKIQTEVSVKKDKPPVITSPYVAPTVSLMKDVFFDPNEVAEDYQEKARTLEETLEQFKVPAKVMSVTPGPAVTRYELQMPPGVPVSKLTSRANDIAMCLASNGEIRIEAPIPGKSLLGIELPNKKRQKVGLKEVIDSSEFMGNKSPVAFALGKDITGKNIIVDFTKIPHLLVAGSTGSGKSVCLNTLIISILYKSSPEEVRLILIDPKRVEFNVYNGLPHLMLKDVITEADKAISAFNWAINEMDRRFELFKNSGAKDIIAYNEKIKNTGETKLPRIMIIVDELAELMMVNKRELEEKIKKISQLSRAAGIHLILATQRPSVDIITGVIKANLSTRVTFKLMTQADSRTILDSSGAEKLLGEGDMIFLTTNIPKPVRLQGPFISMSEVEAIVDFIKHNNESYFDDEIADKILNPIVDSPEAADGEAPEEQDKYFLDALRLAIDSGQISISMVQRKFAVGYSRAGKIIDEMERQNFISPFEGSKPRQVLISRDEYERRFGSND